MERILPTRGSEERGGGIGFTELEKDLREEEKEGERERKNEKII